MKQLFLAFVIFTLGTCLASTSASATDSYPKQDLLLEPSVLASASDAAQYIVLDARHEQSFSAGHIPFARLVDHATWADSFGDGDNTLEWSKRIGLLGVNRDSKIVVYDDNQSKNAARIWWILRYWGAQDVRLLNGGWVSWEQGKFTIEKKSSRFSPTQFIAVADPSRIATKRDLLVSLKVGGNQIVDARSEKEFCGLEALSNKRAGAIPGAKQLEWIDLIDPTTQRFKAASDLKRLFDNAGVKLDMPTTTHCQSGGRAAVMAFALELMGAKEVRNYYRSWGEWGNVTDTPIVQSPLK